MLRDLKPQDIPFLVSFLNEFEAEMENQGHLAEDELIEKVKKNKLLKAFFFKITLFFYKEVLKENPGPIFVASIEQSIKNYFQNYYPDNSQKKSIKDWIAAFFTGIAKDVPDFEDAMNDAFYATLKMALKDQPLSIDQAFYLLNNLQQESEQTSAISNGNNPLYQAVMTEIAALKKEEKSYLDKIFQLLNQREPNHETKKTIVSLLAEKNIQVPDETLVTAKAREKIKVKIINQYLETQILAHELTREAIKLDSGRGNVNKFLAISNQLSKTGKRSALFSVALGFAGLALIGFSFYVTLQSFMVASPLGFLGIQAGLSLLSAAYVGGGLVLGGSSLIAANQLRVKSVEDKKYNEKHLSQQRLFVEDIKIRRHSQKLTESQQAAASNMQIKMK